MRDATRTVLIAVGGVLLVLILVPLLFMSGMMGSMMGGGQCCGGGSWLIGSVIALVLLAGVALMVIGWRRT